MNKEIKEILNSIKYAIDEDDWFEIEGHFLKPLLDYIINLQEENEKLKAPSNYYQYASKSVKNNCESLQQRIDKAVEYIRENCILSDCWEDLDFCNFVPVGRIKYKSLSSKKVKELLDIFKGSEE